MHAIPKQTVVDMKKIISTIIVTGSLVFALSGALQAADTNSRYQRWTPPSGESVASSQPGNDDRLQNMVDELNRLIDDADKARAADRQFIEDLRGVVNQYDWPWRKTIVDEDFTDGYMTKNSNWQTIAGDFQLRRGLGLYSDVEARQQPAPGSSSQTSSEEAAALLIGAIFDQAMKKDKKETATSRQHDDYASIASKKTVSNAFAIDMTLDVSSLQGQFEIGVYQGNPNGNGYRLVFQPGAGNGSIELLRLGSRGKSIIDLRDKLSAKGDQIHRLQWTRTKVGNMSISLNGKTILQTADRSFKDKFTGIVMNNQGGAFAVKQLTVQGT